RATNTNRFKQAARPTPRRHDYQTSINLFLAESHSFDAVIFNEKLSDIFALNHFNASTSDSNRQRIHQQPIVYLMVFRNENGSCSRFGDHRLKRMQGIN